MLSISKKHILFSILATFSFVAVNAQHNPVRVIGKMSKIGKEFNLNAEVSIDTIVSNHLYALGPVENLRGEIIIWDNKKYVAALTEEKQPMLLKNVKNLKAIFMVSSIVKSWDTLLIIEKIGSIQQLQVMVGNMAAQNGIDTNIAFPFLLIGKVKSGKGHIMFKDTSSKEVNAEVLKAAKNINTFSGIDARMLGFYSKNHKGVFTHSDSFVHIHYLLSNRYQAGHLDEVEFESNSTIKLLIPKK